MASVKIHSSVSDNFHQFWISILILEWVLFGLWKKMYLDLCCWLKTSEMNLFLKSIFYREKKKVSKSWLSTCFRSTCWKYLVDKIFGGFLLCYWSQLIHDCSQFFLMSVLLSYMILSKDLSIYLFINLNIMNDKIISFL